MTGWLPAGCSRAMSTLWTTTPSVSGSCECGDWRAGSYPKVKVSTAAAGSKNPFYAKCKSWHGHVLSRDQASSTVKHVHMQHALQPTNPSFHIQGKVVLTVRRIQKLRIGNRDRLDAGRIDLPDAAGLLASSPFMQSLRRCRWAFRRPRRLSSSFASSAVSFRLIRPLLMNSAQSTGAIIFVRKSVNCQYVGTHRINTTLFSTKSLQTRRSKSVWRSVGIWPVVARWSKRLFASVITLPGIFKCWRHVGAISWTPVSNICRISRR